MIEIGGFVLCFIFGVLVGMQIEVEINQIEVEINNEAIEEKTKHETKEYND